MSVIELSIDTPVHRISFSAVERDDEEEDVGFSRTLTIETAEGTFEIELYADDEDALDVVVDGG